MYFLLRFLPILLFILLFVGSGVYCTLLGMDNAFYQLSPVTAIIPAIALGWALHRGTTQEKARDFLDGVRHRDIINMCMIFLLAGIFSEVTKSIGSVESTVNFALSVIPSHFLLVSLFIISAFIATSIGTSMATVATIAPIAAGISAQGDIQAALSIATVVGGATFGDNLSLISDTTIAAVSSQKANMKEKLKINAKIALVAALFTVIILWLSTDAQIAIPPKAYSFFLITPYLLLLTLAVSGINVFVSLVISTAFAGCVGWVTHGYGLFDLSRSLNAGMTHMNEIMVLSLMVGGLSGLSGQAFTQRIADRISAWINHKRAGVRISQLVIAKIASLFDIMLANNTIAIILGGNIAREIGRKHQIPPAYCAAWLDIFSCVFQGLIPHGAQILLASSIAGLSPLLIIPHVYYCYILGVVAVLHILWVPPPRHVNKTAEAG